MKRLPCVLLILCCVCSAPQGQAESLSSRRFSSLDCFGSVATLVLYDDFSAPENLDRAASAWQDILGRFDEIERSISLDIADSDAVRFAAATPGEIIQVSEHFFLLTEMALDLYAETEGMYNPGVGLLVDLWGFSPRFLEDNTKTTQLYDRPWLEGHPLLMPNEEYIIGFTQLAAAFPNVICTRTDEGFFVTKPADAYVVIDGTVYTLMLDFGGSGKGYACDHAISILEAYGFEYGYISAGSSSMRFLSKPTQDGNWSVGIRNPFITDETDHVCALLLQNTSMSTSGTYINRYTLNGSIYHHIMNPATGYPSKGELVSATIIGESAARCDALTTALIAMDAERAQRFASENALRCLLVFQSEDSYSIFTTMDDSMFQFR